MQAGNHSADNLELHKLVAKNKFGTFFGVSQEIFDKVWSKLTAADSNSVVYISMEIGADPDVFHPIKDTLMDLEKTDSMDSNTKQFIKKLFHGPEKIPCYGGGLGVLAGDTLKSFADCRVPVVAVSLLYRHGYFSQIVDSKLGQISQTVEWRPEDTPGLYLLHDPDNPEKPLQIEIPFFNEYDQETMAEAQVWMKMEVNHSLDYFIPELLLDFSLADNPIPIRDAAGQLYNSDSSIIKATQRRMLGTGILPVMEAIGITSSTLHLNEQHGVVVALQLIAEELQGMLKHSNLCEASEEQIFAAADKVAKRLVYTIHTPVKAGHDRFNKSVYAGISHKSCRHILELLAHDDESPHSYNFTTLAMRVNRTANSVSRLHRDVTHKQFPRFAQKITAITNGVHHLTWISDARAELFDSFPELAGWRDNPGVLQNAKKLQHNKQFRTYLLRAWEKDSEILYQYINSMLLLHRNEMTSTWIDPPNHYSNIIDDTTRLTPDVFTIGFARRFSTYKRADLIFDNIDTLCSIALKNNWPINFLFSGKAHPADEPGKSVIKLILDYQKELHVKSKGLVNLIFIPNYDMQIAKVMVAGVHAWLNNPKRPLEASGTSGMKAALNGVPNLSIMDGWWVEGYHDGLTGWKFGHEGPVDEADLSESPEALLYAEDSASFYEMLPGVLEEFYGDSSHSRLIDKAIMNLSLNIPIFNTHRMAAEYLQKYQLKLPATLQARMDDFAALYNSNE
ncbi:alpha-glucan phosphorylase [Desulfocapsa sulfexigens DSM 10523]|uniref:glycogen phosphorylase n=1 Tax=Desulfocapsa sulfexigens (strain DSM 10523 / SB164P1) TaxID=1167006 RepID=M1PG75_DESSD|nr:alpha-glucan family phosphorylase [Desulfocapsa sulfexigens]AGF78665.1 alpha-glucan phosphorylase [Desulfocapsa sulfexigens DSM 10523]